MASKPIKLPKDTQGQEYYPATTTEAVVDRKRVKALSEILDDIDEAIANSGSGGGSSVTIVNNLTEGGADKALSAEMGKTLLARIEEVAGQVEPDFDLGGSTSVPSFDLGGASAMGESIDFGNI